MKADKRKKDPNSPEEVERGIKDTNSEALNTNEESVHFSQELQARQIELEIQKNELIHLREELQEYRNKHSILFDLAPLSYVTLDTKGIILEANLTLAELLEIPRQNLIGSEFIQFVDLVSRNIFQEHLNNALESGVRQTCELVMRKSQDSSFTAKLESIGVRDAKGCLSQCRTIITTTFQEHSSPDINQYQKKYEIPSVDAIVGTDNSLNITSWSKTAEEMFGWKAEEVLGTQNSLQVCTKILDVLTREEVMRDLQENESWSGEAFSYKKDGSKLKVLISIGVVWDNAKHFNGIIAVFHEFPLRQINLKDKNIFTR